MWLSTLQSLGQLWISICNWVLVNRSKQVKNWSVWRSYQMQINLMSVILITFFPYHHLTIILYLRWIVSLEIKAGSIALTLFHCNIRSLPKNLSLLHDILYCLDSRPNIIAISETRLNENSDSNIELSHYYFFHHDSPTYCSRWSRTLCLKKLKINPKAWFSIRCRAGQVLLGRGWSL